MTGGSGGKTYRTGDPTGAKGVKLAEISKQISAIDRALLKIPPEYREGVWEGVMNNSAYPTDAHRNTYGYWKARFVYEVAYNMMWV